MAAKVLPAPEALRQLISYEPETGSFIWKERPASLFASGGQHSSEHNCRVWNAKYAGKPAGAVDRSLGYLRLTVLGSKVWAHRAAWMMVYGAAPQGQIDHIDGNGLNNRIANLRAVSPAENRKNQKIPVNNRSGAIGVSWNARNGNWNASITVARRKVFLGAFDGMDAAIRARKAAEERYGFHANHGRACGGELAGAA